MSYVFACLAFSVQAPILPVAPPGPSQYWIQWNTLCLQHQKHCRKYA